MNLPEESLKRIILLIFDLLKKHFRLIMSTEKENINIYPKVKILIMKCLEKYLKMEKPVNDIITRSVADCICTIILSGCFHHWTTCISELINESIKGNDDLCYIVLRALGDIDYLILYTVREENSYTNPIYITNADKERVKGGLINNNQIVKNFIIKIYENLKNLSDNEKRKEKYIIALFDAIRCWSTLDLNIFKNEKLAEIVYYIVDNYQIEKPDSFYDLISDSIMATNNAKKYQYIGTKGKTPEQISEELFKLIDNEEREGLNYLLKFLFPKLEFIMKNDLAKIPEEKRKLYISFLFVFGSVIENYIYLFFNFSDKNSKEIFKYFQFFLKHKIKKISDHFIEGLGEMRTFINDYYRFAGLNDNQKSEFINYFMVIFFGVLENCAYNKLPINNMKFLEEEILNINLNISKNSAFFNNYENKNIIDEYNDEFIEETMSVEKYRITAGEVFEYIFTIFLENFGDDHCSYFLREKLLSTIYDINIINSQQYPLIIDVFFFVLNSLSRIIELENPEKSWKTIKKVINDFLEAKIVLENQGIFIDYIVMIYNYCSFIGKENDIFWKVIKFIMNATKSLNNEKIERSCFTILSKLCGEKDENIQINTNIIDELFNLFNEKYLNYSFKKIPEITDLIKTIFSLLGIKESNQNNNISQKKMSFYKGLINKIIEPINIKIKELLCQYELNMNDTGIKDILLSKIIKSFSVQKEIIIKLSNFNSELKDYFINNYLEKYLFLTEKIIHLFYDTIIEEFVSFYKIIAKHIEQTTQSNIENLNNFLINLSFSPKGNNNYELFDILTMIYSNLFILAEKNKNEQLYLQLNNYFVQYFMKIVQNLMGIISKSDLKNKEIKNKLKALFKFIIKVFPKLIINPQNHNELKIIEDLINFLIYCITILINLEKEVEINSELLISNLCSSFNAIFNNKYYINSNSNISNYLFNSVQNLWEVIYFKMFNATSRNNFVYFYATALKYDVNTFCGVFSKLIENKYEKKYINAIIEYLLFFKDNNSKCKEMITTVIEIIKGSENLKKLEFFQIVLTKEKKQNKIKINI